MGAIPEKSCAVGLTFSPVYGILCQSSDKQAANKTGEKMKCERVNKPLTIPANTLTRGQVFLSGVGDGPYLKTDDGYVNLQNGYHYIGQLTSEQVTVLPDAKVLY